jgi:hypothetical protein
VRPVITGRRASGSCRQRPVVRRRRGRRPRPRAAIDVWEALVGAWITTSAGRRRRGRGRLVADRGGNAGLVDAKQDQVSATGEEPGGGRGDLIVRRAVDEAFAIKRGRVVAAGGDGRAPFGVGRDVKDDDHRRECRRPSGGSGAFSGRRARDARSSRRRTAPRVRKHQGSATPRTGTGKLLKTNQEHGGTSPVRRAMGP